MYDSRQFLQFMVDRRLGFDQDRNLFFDADRNLLFNPDRNLLFDPDRDIPFGKVGPVFRGQACPNCKHLIHPLEDVCRHCGAHVDPLRQVVPQKMQYAAQAKRKARMVEAAPRAVTRQRVTPQQVAPQQVQVIDEGAKQICPNCSLRIPADAVYCPRCRVKLDEWRKYIHDLRRWESEQARSQQQQYGSDRFYDVPSRRR
jgi:RNA polymerase subunit RPABC4/transcription elongation factor Spt4